MKKWLIAAVILFLSYWSQRVPTLAFQQANTNGNIVVANCGTPPAVYPAAGNRAPGTVNTDGELCAGVAVSATIATDGLAISVASGASTSGITGTPIFVQALTANPLYTVGGFYSPSMDMNGGLRTNCISGCSGGTTDTEDGSVAAGQSTGITIPLNYGFNGTAWERFRMATGNGFPGGALVVTMPTTSGNIGTVTVTDGAGALNTIVDSGTITAVTSITDPVTITDGAGALNVIVDSGTLTAVTAITNALPAGTNNIGDVDVLTFPDNEPFNVAQVGGTAVLSATTAGMLAVGPGIVGNVAPSGLADGTVRALSLDSTGALRTAGGSNAAAGSTGSGVPASASYTGANVGGTLRGITATASGPSFGLDVNVIAGSGLTISNITTDTAVGAAVTENPVGIGGIYTATPVAVDSGDRTGILTDPFGRVSITGAATAGATTNVGNPVLTGALSGAALTALTMSPVNSGLQTSPAGRTAVVTITSAVTATGASAPTDSAMVTVAAGTRVVVYYVGVQCGSTVSTAVTATMGFGTANIPAVTGKIFSMPATTASQFQGFERGAGFPNILGMGASDEDLRLTMSTPTGGQCTVSVTYTTEAS